MLVIGVAICAATLGRLAVWGFAPGGSLDAITIGCFAVGLSLVVVAGTSPRPRDIVESAVGCEGRFAGSP